jgi:carbamoyl-phosphate synthase small subunit
MFRIHEARTIYGVRNISGNDMSKKGYLFLENGTVLEGESFGSESPVDGEVVFNTGMMGYPEGFTDPSYCGQILTLTYPLIGNYGVPDYNIKKGLPQVLESEKIHIAGLIVSSYIDNHTHWQAKKTLSAWLCQEGIPALSGIDTRTLTKTIREVGVLKGSIQFTSRKMSGSFLDINKENLVARVSCTKKIEYGNGKTRILVLDCGLKYNQLKLFLKYDTTLIRVPWDYNPFTDPSAPQFDALFISNGPGDPKMANKTVQTVKEAIKRKIPTLGICLGNQILALAIGADTFKLKYGHRGQNQPVKDTISGRCYITTQNHGFAVDTSTLPSGWTPWFENLNDGTNEGIRFGALPFYSTQFHPESTPGPTDTEWVFPKFIEDIKKWNQKI